MRHWEDKGYHIESGFAGLVLQWMEDLSDRELERFLQENNAGKLFCGFSLLEKTPDHSYFSVLRDKIGTKRLADLFGAVNKQLRSKGFISDIFHFVDASQMISKISLWKDRDKAIEAGLERFNNNTAAKVAITPANITDSQALKHVCPKQGVVYADKGYCDQTAQKTMKTNGCENRAILKNNMRGKDFIRDSKISKRRMPFERVFSKQNKKARYRGICKN